MSPSSNHDQIVSQIVGVIGNRTRSAAELMVVIESIILAVLLLLVRLHSHKPTSASVLMETALQRATERFSEKQK